MTSRLANLIHHIITLANPEELGATRLAKILWFSDVESYRELGRTISRSDKYRRKDQGPLHVDFYSAISELEASEKIVRRTSLTVVGPRTEFVWRERPVLSEFSGDEIAIVDRVAASILKLTAKGASDLSHDVLWHNAVDGEWMPVPAAAVVAGEVSDEVMNWAEETFDVDCEATQRI